MSILQKKVHTLGNPKVTVTIRIDSENEHLIDPDTYDLRVDPKDNIVYRYDLNQTTFDRIDHTKTCLLTAILGDVATVEQAEDFVDFTVEALQQFHEREKIEASTKNSFDDEKFIIYIKHTTHLQLSIQLSQEDFEYLKVEVMENGGRIRVRNDNLSHPYIAYSTKAKPHNQGVKALSKIIYDRMLAEKGINKQNYCTKLRDNNPLNLRRTNIILTSPSHSNFIGVSLKKKKFYSKLKHSKYNHQASPGFACEESAAIYFDIMYTALHEGDISNDKINFPQLSEHYLQIYQKLSELDDLSFKEEASNVSSILTIFLQGLGELHLNEKGVLHLHDTGETASTQKRFHIDGNPQNFLSNNLANHPIQTNKRGIKEKQLTNGIGKYFKATIYIDGKEKDVGSIISDELLLLYLSYDIYNPYRNMPQPLNFPCLKHIYQDVVSDLSLPDMELETRKAFMATLESLAQTIIDMYFPADYEPSN